ncbi:MAG: hypothetical protein JWN01_593 [Patescibacteria group bacterium]|nr:hypothetical protein [Patescibacteria group bacterium]
MKDSELKTTLSEDAENYHNYRPRYPRLFFETM